MDRTNRIREYIISNFYVADPGSLRDDASLLDAGIIDSTGVLEVVAYVESTFGIKVADSELLPENFESISRISSYVGRKSSESLRTGT